MAQQGGFGTLDLTPSTEGGNVFGSRLETSSARANLFGRQSDQTSKVFEPIDQSSPDAVSFREQTNEASPSFGSAADFRTRRDVTDLYRGAVGASVFGGQMGPSLSSSTGTVFGRTYGFGAAATTSGQSGQAAGFTTSTTSHAFGTPGPVSAFSPFGTSQPSVLFGSSNQSLSSSSLFPGSTSSTASVPFGTGQAIFTQPAFSVNQTLQSNVSGASFDTPSVSSSSFSMQGSNVFGSFPFSASSGSSTAGSIFGMGLSSSAGIRKRDSNGAISSNALIGKHDMKGSGQFGPVPVLATTAPVFTMKQNVPLHTSTSLFSSAVSAAGMKFSSSTTGVRPPGDTVSFGQKHTDVPRTEHGDREKVLFGKQQSEFSDVRGSGSAQTMGPLFHLSHSVDSDPHNSTPTVGAPTESASASSNTRFGDHMNSSSSQSQKRSSPVGMLKKPVEKSSDQSQNTLFGKPLQPMETLFGKPLVPTSTRSLDKDQNSRSQDAFGKSSVHMDRSKSAVFGRTASSFNLIQQDNREVHQGVLPERDLSKKEQRQGVDKERERKIEEQSNITRKSLSKWNRAKDVPEPDRKRRVLPLSTEPPRDSKKSRIFEGEKSASAPAASVRLSSSRMSVDDLTSKNSIIVKDIPSHFNRGPILRTHFSRFGTITRLQPLVMKRAANITFKTHEEALAAKNDGKYLDPGGPPLSIFWRASSKPKSPDDKQKHFREYETRSGRPKTKPVPGSVEDELASMAELPDYQEEFPATSKQYDLQRSVPVRKRSPTPPPPAPAPQVLDSDVAKGLLKSIYRAQAKDTAEKVAILDSKDKLLRLLRGRQQTDLATAKAFVGTCPDMCPEKERYYREDIRRLSLYEIIPSTATSLTGLKSKVDHFRAVKEYSRSSADQEEPLPYELRPLSVLVTTMNYLLSQVADLGEEGKWAEWYDFLWNRTRGIRKDITQQQLCDVQVAELLEKCARFHIFCSERLCEEDMMSFDAKINNENLTKCLQTLKELYADLEKRGVFCPNEAEFRCYMILMNLNEGDILREIQQLRPEIRDSHDISFAVQVYNALNANNYVRFFRLIEERATFLNACILHRYFNQIRSKGLLIIMKAHGALGKNIVMYPVEEMIRLLCFEDAKEVESFCYHYCLSLKGVDVVLDSKAYTEPEGSLPQTRSQSLIEIKQENVSIGQIINGSPLPPLQLPTPSSSFDQDGVFIMSSDIQEALESSKLFRPKALPNVEETKVQRERILPSVVETMVQRERILPSVVETKVPRERILPSVEEAKVQRERILPIVEVAKLHRERLMYSNEVVKSLARIVILEVIDTSIMEIAKDVVKEELDLSAVIKLEIEDVINSSVEEALRQIAQEVYEEQELKLRKKLEEEMVAQRQRVFNTLCEDIVDDTVANMTKKMAEEEMSLVEAELHRQRKELCSQQCSDDILRQVVDEMTEDVAAEVHDVDVVMKQERLEATEKVVMIIRCRRFLQAWRMKYLAQIRVKRAMLDFPSAPSVKSLSEQIHKLLPVRPDTRISQKSFYIGERAKLSIGSPMDVIQEQLHLNVHLSMASARHMLGNLVMWRALDMTQTVNSQLQRAFQSFRERGLIELDTASLQWKLVVSLPRFGPSSTPEESTFSKWIRTKLCRSAERETLLETTPSYEGEVLSLYQMNDSGQKQSAVSTGLCIRCFHGTWTDNEELSVRKKDLLKGTSAVMFVLPCAENLKVWNQSSQQATWKKEKQRLHQILKQKPQVPAVPLILIIPRLLSTSSISAKVLDDNLDLSDLHRLNLISAVHVAQPFVGDQEQTLQCFGDWTSQLANCLRFAANNTPAPPKLRAKPVTDYIEDAIVELYKAPVYQDLRTRTRQQLLHQSPNTLLSLYNEVVEHAAMVSASSSLAQMSWPAPELDHSQPTGHPRSSWNTEAYMCDLYELVSKMRLPYFRYSDMEAEDWSVVCHDVWSYVAAVTKKDSGSAKICLHQQVAELLSRCKKIFNQFCWLAYKDGPCEPTYINMAWTDLLDACIHYKLLSLRTGHISLRRHEDEDELIEDDQEPQNVVVYYQESELDDWEPPRIWLDALRDTETAEPGQLKSTVEKAAEVRRDETVADSMEMSAADEGATEVTSSSMTVQWADSGSASTTDNATSSGWTNLKLLLEQERAASEKYEKALESCLSQSNTSLEMASRKDTSPLGSFLSPIKSDMKTRTQELGVHVNQHLNMSYRKQNDRFNRSEAFRTSQRSSYHLEVSTPVNSRLGRQLLTEDRDRESAGARDVHDSISSPSTLSERLSDLHNMVLSEKQANILFEMRLKSFLDPI